MSLIFKKHFSCTACVQRHLFFSLLFCVSLTANKITLYYEIGNKYYFLIQSGILFKVPSFFTSSFLHFTDCGPTWRPLKFFFFLLPLIWALIHWAGRLLRDLTALSFRDQGWLCDTQHPITEWNTVYMHSKSHTQKHIKQTDHRHIF